MGIMKIQRFKMCSLAQASRPRFVACKLRYSVEGQSRRDSPIAFGRDEIDVQVVGSTKISRVDLGRVSEYATLLRQF